MFIYSILKYIINIGRLHNAIGKVPMNKLP